MEKVKVTLKRFLANGYFISEQVIKGDLVNRVALDLSHIEKKPGVEVEAYPLAIPEFLIRVTLDIAVNPDPNTLIETETEVLAKVFHKLECLFAYLDLCKMFLRSESRHYQWDGSELRQVVCE